MTMPDILVQRPPRPAKIDSNGLSASLQWELRAISDVHALLKLQQTLGLVRGAVYRTPDGQVPNIYCRCQSILAETKTPARWNPGIGYFEGLYIVTADYAVVTTNVGPQPGGPTRWSIRGSETTEPVDLDLDGRGIKSSSEETPDPPLTRRNIEYILHGEFYYAAPDELTAAAAFKPWAGTVNDRYLDFLGADVGSLFISPFTTEPGDTGWIKMTVDISHKPSRILQDGNTYEGWLDVFQDRGTRRIADSTKLDPMLRYANITDAGGRAGQSDWALNGLGQPLPFGSNDVLRWVRHYPFSDFSQIPFP